MKLFKHWVKQDRDVHGAHPFDQWEEATLSDLKAALAEFNMVAVPVEPTKAMIKQAAWNNADHYAGFPYKEIYKAMIQAAQED